MLHCAASCCMLTLRSKDFPFPPDNGHPGWPIHRASANMRREGSLRDTSGQVLALKGPMEYSWQTFWPPPCHWGVGEGPGCRRCTDGRLRVKTWQQAITRFCWKLLHCSSNWRFDCRSSRFICMILHYESLWRFRHGYLAVICRFNSITTAGSSRIQGIVNPETFGHALTLTPQNVTKHLFGHHWTSLDIKRTNLEIIGICFIFNLFYNILHMASWALR